MKNSKCAELAENAVRHFRDECSGSPLNDVDGWDEAIGDLIANIGHLASQKGIPAEDFRTLLDRSFAMFEEEVAEPDDPEDEDEEEANDGTNVHPE